jgi:integrase
VKTGIVRAVSLVGRTYPSRNTAPLLSEWSALLAALPSPMRRKLSAGARYFSREGILPDATTLDDLHRYRDVILNDRLRANAESAWDHFLWAWNRAATLHPSSWPQTVVPRPVKRDIYVFPFAYFPPSFEADVKAYADRLANTDLDDDGPARPAKPATISTRTYQLRAAASALAHSDVYPAAITQLAFLVEIDNFKTILHFFMKRAGGGTSSNVAQMATCLRNVARHMVKVDEEHERKITSLCRKVAVPTGGLTTKNRERLRPFDDTVVAGEFLQLPETIRRHVERDKRTHAQKAVLAQVAAAIAILQAIPIRIANLVSIDLHRHLKQQRSSVHLVIPEAETKNRQAVDFRVPDYALDILKWYVVNYRQHLEHEPTSALFPGRNGGHKTTNALGQQIKQTVFKFTGLAFNVHLFRHFAGKVFLDQQPGGYEVVRQVLRHKRIDTTTSFYAGAEVQRASTLFNDIIDGLRREHPVAPRKQSKVRS